MILDKCYVIARPKWWTATMRDKKQVYSKFISLNKLVEKPNFISLMGVWFEKQRYLFDFSWCVCLKRDKWGLKMMRRFQSYANWRMGIWEKPKGGRKACTTTSPRRKMLILSMWSSSMSSKNAPSVILLSIGPKLLLSLPR